MIAIGGNYERINIMSDLPKVGSDEILRFNCGTTCYENKPCKNFDYYFDGDSLYGKCSKRNQNVLIQIFTEKMFRPSSVKSIIKKVFYGGKVGESN